MNDETTIKQTFHLYQRHMNLLDEVNAENHAQALRTILDSIINGKEKAERKKTMDTSVIVACMGLLFLIFSYLFDGVLQRGIMIGIGVLIISYGLIGGIEIAIQRSR